MLENGACRSLRHNTMSILKLFLRTLLSKYHVNSFLTFQVIVIQTSGQSVVFSPFSHDELPSDVDKMWVEKGFASVGKLSDVVQCLMCEHMARPDSIRIEKFAVSSSDQERVNLILRKLVSH